MTTEPSARLDPEQCVRELREAAIVRFAALLDEALALGTEYLRREALRILVRELLGEASIVRARAWLFSPSADLRTVGAEAVELEGRSLAALRRLDPVAAAEAEERRLEVEHGLIAHGYFTARDGLIALTARIEQARGLPRGEARQVARLALEELEAPALQAKVAELGGLTAFAPLLERLDATRAAARALLDAVGAA